MSKNLIKNRRFRTGSHVNIHYAPVYEGYTIAISDSTAAGLFQITATFNDNLSAEMFNVGDICAFSFGVGIISTKQINQLVVDFPNSMFPDGDVMRYVGSEYQNVLIFLENDRILPDMVVNKYTEDIAQATYGYAKVVYNLQTDATLALAPVRRIDDGVLSQVIISKGYVLKSCDDEDYDNNLDNWMPEFPIELSGTSIDPIYRRAYLKKRVIENKGLKAKSTLSFKLIG